MIMTLAVVALIAVAIVGEAMANEWMLKRWQRQIQALPEHDPNAISSAGFFMDAMKYVDDQITLHRLSLGKEIEASHERYRNGEEFVDWRDSETIKEEEEKFQESIKRWKDV